MCCLWSLAAYTDAVNRAQAERYYNSAHEHKPAALQPFHGLVQLYRRTGAHDKHAQALRHVLANSKGEASKYGTRVEPAKALIQSNQAMEASEVLIAIEDGLRDGCLSEEVLELPEEVSILQADCQLALDEAEYNTRIQSTLDAAHSRLPNCSAEENRDDDLLIQEVAATWVRLPKRSITMISTVLSIGNFVLSFETVSTCYCTFSCSMNGIANGSSTLLRSRALTGPLACHLLFTPVSKPMLHMLTIQRVSSLVCVVCLW